MKHLHLIYLILCVAALSCDSDNPVINENPSGPDIDLNSKWDTIFCAIKPEIETYIGRRFVGVQNWPHNSNPPSIYVDAVYPEESFGTNFDKEVTGEKNPEDLDPELFFRANRQYIVRISEVSSMKSWFHQSQKCRLKHFPDLEIVISKDRAPRFKEWLKGS